MGKKYTQSGFTIIEILIVLAIAGFLILLVFIAIPTVNRIARDNGRKEFVSLVSAQLDDYKITHGNYPNTEPTMCDFIVNYIADAGGGLKDASCDPTFSDNPVEVDGLTTDPSNTETITDACVMVHLARYDICFRDRYHASHYYLGPPDEISIQLSHFCENNHDEDEIIRSTAGDSTDKSVNKWVVWTRLEGTRFTCTSNASS